MSGNFPAFGLSRQYYLGKGLDINYLTSSLFFPHQMFNKIKIVFGFFCWILYIGKSIEGTLKPNLSLKDTEQRFLIFNTRLLLTPFISILPFLPARFSSHTIELSHNRTLLSIPPYIKTLSNLVPSYLMLFWSPLLLSCCWLFFGIHWQELIHGTRRMNGIFSDAISPFFSHALFLTVTVTGVKTPTISSTRVVT